MPDDRLSSEITGVTWDAVIIGTGIAGATIGFALARKGWRVLFCEQGMKRQPGQGEGMYAEALDAAAADSLASPARSAALMRAGRWATTVEDRSQRDKRSFTPFIGCGPGGSSALYGMAMERFFPSDFEPDKTLPNANTRIWPISYAKLEPYYAQAETLYRVRGTCDPLRTDAPQLMPPPQLSDGARAVAARLAGRGLHPYQLPAACEFVLDCASCQGYLCPKNCKNDSGRIALNPAVLHHGATLVDRCRVVRLHHAARQVTSVECIHNGRALQVRGKRVILAAGALSTPELLLRSISSRWPQGLSNASGLVGRNLMRHLIDLYAVDVRAEGAMDNRRKEIAFNDFYGDASGKLGTVQSFGRLPPPAIVMQAIRHDLAQSRYRPALALFPVIAPLLQAYLARMIDGRMTLATIVEDFPNPQNRVELRAGGDAGLAIHYRNNDDARSRVARMRALMRDVLKPWRYRLIDERDNNQRIAHACGTCRFGDDPQTSVVNGGCRSHDVDNLYIVDSSIFPSSGGTNPSLTIAANALRVASLLTGDSTGGLQQWT